MPGHVVACCGMSEHVAACQGASLHVTACQGMSLRVAVCVNTVSPVPPHAPLHLWAQPVAAAHLVLAAPEQLVGTGGGGGPRWSLCNARWLHMRVRGDTGTRTRWMPGSPLAMGDTGCLDAWDYPVPRSPPPCLGGPGRAGGFVQLRPPVSPTGWQCSPLCGSGPAWGRATAVPTLPSPNRGGTQASGGGGGILRPSPSPPPPVLGSPHGRGSPGPGTPRAPGDLWGASKPGSFVPPPSVLQAVAVPAPPAAKG